MNLDLFISALIASCRCGSCERYRKHQKWLAVRATQRAR